MTTQLQDRHYRWDNMLEAEVFLRSCELDAMPPEPRHLFRSRVVAATPLGRAALLVLRQGQTPERAFLTLLEHSDLSDIAASRGFLETCLTLSNDWEIRGKCRRSAALLGLLVRVGVATANDWLIVHAASRLHNVTKRNPGTACFAMAPLSLRQIRQAWCRADLRSSGSHPVHVRSIQPASHLSDTGLHRAERRVEAETFFEGVVLHERLLQEDEPAAQFTPLARERSLFRLMELYAESPVCGVESCVRGLDLVSAWAVSVSSVPCRASRVQRVAQLAEFFASRLAAAGFKGAMTTLAERLDSAVHVLRHRWNADPASRPLAALLAEVRCDLDRTIPLRHNTDDALIAPPPTRHAPVHVARLHTELWQGLTTGAARGTPVATRAELSERSPRGTRPSRCPGGAVYR